MARSAAAHSTTQLVTGIVAGVASITALRTACAAFASPLRAPLVAPTAVATAAALGAAAPAVAEEGGLLNFGKIPLGGGFAINLDIPETGIINIVVLIAGLFYLLAPLLSESMSSREKEIQTDIEDAVAKFNEATERLAEAEKAQSQANEVIAEIDASIAKDKAEFEATVKAQTEVTLQKAAAAAEKTLADLQAGADNKVEAYIQEEAVKRGLGELSSLSEKQKSKFMDAAIAAL
mmetsp:Transcript_47103/g.136139  ORF Transcript_47103/g.136139 Transcript_47103/m.136139 type:complete len:235 (+) Transcript_47103:84-788(+)